MTDKITQNEFDILTKEFEQDMTSCFENIQKDVNALFERAEREEWDPKRLIGEIDNLI